MSVLVAMSDPAVQPPDQGAQAPSAGTGPAAQATPPPIPQEPAPAPAPAFSTPVSPAGGFNNDGPSTFGGVAPGVGPGAGPGGGGGPAGWAPPTLTNAYVTPGRRLVDPDVTEEQKTYAMLMHLSLLLAAPAPFLSIVAPLIMWQIKKRESPFLDDHGREAVNFHISVLIYGLIGLVLTMVVIGIPLLIGVYALGIVGIVLSSIAAKHGEYYRYPMCLRFLK